MIAASYKPKKKFMQLAVAEAKRARDRGDYPIGAASSMRTDSAQDLHFGRQNLHYRRQKDASSSMSMKDVAFIELPLTDKRGRRSSEGF
jgi:hypothetical protein